MGAARRVGLEVIGWSLVVLGVILMPLPGPGTLIVFAGFTVLAQCNDWAARRLAYVKYQALRGAAESVQHPARILVAVLGSLMLVGFGALWLAAPPPPSWWVVPDWWWLPGGNLTAVVFFLSAAAALGLLRYAHVRFRGRPDAVVELRAQFERERNEHTRGYGAEDPVAQAGDVVDGGVPRARGGGGTGVGDRAPTPRD